MICLKCQTRMPSNYKKCPVCGYSKLVKEEFATQGKEEEEEKVEAISPYVEGSELDDMED